jgi:hypothetical protein
MGIFLNPCRLTGDFFFRASLRCAPIQVSLSLYIVNMFFIITRVVSRRFAIVVERPRDVHGDMHQNWTYYDLCRYKNETPKFLLFFLLKLFQMRFFIFVERHFKLTYSCIEAECGSEINESLTPIVHLCHKTLWLSICLVRLISYE